MVGMFMCDEYGVERAIDIDVEHLLPEVRTTVDEYARIAFLYNGRRAQTPVTWVERCAYLAMTAYHRNTNGCTRA
jgi:hypothetical protein